MESEDLDQQMKKLMVFQEIEELKESGDAKLQNAMILMSELKYSCKRLRHIDAYNFRCEIYI